MSTEIYYFSGTGNTLMIAQKLAERLSASLVPVSFAIEKKTVRSGASVIGIVFPVYYGNLPLMVRAFAEKLENAESKYIFAVANFGGGKGVSIKTLSRIIRSRGGRLAAGYGIQMPQNSWHKSGENRKKIAEKCRNTNTRKRIFASSSFLFDLLQIPLQLLFDHLVKNHFIRITGETKNMTLEKMIPLADRSFTVNETCGGCGICAEACPARNIQIAGKRPQWQHRCENCLACYNWCPKKAISAGILQKDFHYLNPDITLRSFTAAQKKY